MSDQTPSHPSPRDPAAAAPTALGVGELAQKLGIDLVEVTPDRATATMPVAGNRQPFGLLHGGANAALAETIGSIHAFTLAAEGRVPVGIELSCAHHRSAREGVVTAICTPLHVGRTLGTFEIVISDDTGRRLCTARLTVAFIDQPR